MHRVIRASIVLLIILAPGVGTAALDTSIDPRWIDHPARPGPDLPPAGRSLFDKLFTARDGTYAVPFPFEILTTQLAAHVINTEGHAIPTVLIPLGRSLQREAGAPHYFEFPRTVITVDGEPPADAGPGLQLRYRLFIGYQPRAEALEVISYNTEAGRFEFQVVDGYAPGRTPNVRYANRTLCMSCHHNAGPIFARTPWDETNFNADIAAKLAAALPDRFARAVDAVSDDAAIIDHATDRANYFAPYQLLWQKGCGASNRRGAECRAAVVKSALQYRLSGERDFDDRSEYRSALGEELRRNWAVLWPEGLFVATADIPNRNPLVPDDTEGNLNPLAPRAPQAVWAQPDDVVLWGMVTRLSEFFTDSDIQRFDRALRQEATAQRATLETDCHIFHNAPKYLLECAGGRSALRLKAELHEGPPGVIEYGRIDELRLPGERNLIAANTTVGTIETDSNHKRVRLPLIDADEQLSIRTGDGRRLSELSVIWPAAEGKTSSPARGELTLIEDWAPLNEALERMVTEASTGQFSSLSAIPLQRKLIVSDLDRHLGLAPQAWCCDLPPPGTKESVSPPLLSQRVARYQNHCAACHTQPGRNPPGFLSGPSSVVEDNLRQCAPRILRRLRLWEQPDGGLSPMPPSMALGLFAHDEHSWPMSQEWLGLISATRQFILDETGQTGLAAILSADYPSLRPCLQSE